MTRAEGNLLGEEVSIGDEVILTEALPQQYRLNTHNRLDLAAGTRYVVTRVENESLVVRSIATFSVRVGYHNEQKNCSFRINRGVLMFQDPNYVPPPPPRKLGEKPEDTEEQEFLPISDPRIQWMWDDLGKYADGQSWCPEYDGLCRAVGIPGRPQDYNVTRTLNGIQIRATLKARSQQEANAMFASAIAGQGGSDDPAAADDE